ncbi:Deoxyguanosinetriphosphate triphosphohydrolase [Anaerohalosphaera lusitana]|uniref:Deoxyguanosinetriphosphate triphosphohydrolase-like protein n=1 Tax=Anaerohalosphaera lusitana TaxID=1936003 RepID=A0A1U9NJC0_9BACT|nr:deoxyguanosinetriphosphate triphosphohydrolase [Anaerohalosphaera lusitana]AQT67616.1 Deoxyguanosinetriphosphate triphosphohydrolase [Anaerohalosphaera lusitana]
MLAQYAIIPDISRGRKYDTKPHPYRGDFERDRDRIIHSQAFRRLEGKTQVFVAGVNDNYRNRLTHSIEVAQIGRTIARALNLNESLTEAICLAHDVGHSPFGHAGEHTINEIMAPHGGFEHNLQAMRIVDLIEHPYPDFQGLNLMYETRLGLALHSSPYDKPETMSEFAELRCSLEGQIANVADRIAYNCHDLEDGLRSRFIEEPDLTGIELFDRARELINAPAITDIVVRKIRTAKAVIDMLVSDCIATSTRAIADANIATVRDVYRHTDPLIILSDDADAKLQKLESFLMKNMYKHDDLIKGFDTASGWLRGLFEKLCEDPEQMPSYYRGFIESEGLQRVVCDYIAGMTDRYCEQMVRRLSIA